MFARRGRLLLIIGAIALSAGLARACMAPFDFWPAALVCWVPVFLVASSLRYRDRALVVGCGSAAAAVAGFWFLPAAIAEQGNQLVLMGILALMVVALVEAVPFTVAALVLPMKDARLLLFAPVAAAFETLLFDLPGLPGFSFANLLHASPELSQLAANGGAIAVSTLVLASNALIAAALGAKKKRFYWLLTILLGATYAYGVLRLSKMESILASAPSLRIGVVQSNYSSLQLKTQRSYEVLRDLSLTLTQREPSPELIIWPEGADTSRVSSETLRLRATRYWMTDTRRPEPRPRFMVPLILGVPFLDSEESLYNAALFVATDGRRIGTYRKRGLVPLAEASIELGSLSLSPAIPFRRGMGPELWRFGEARILPMICVEDIDASVVGEDVSELSPNLLLSLSSGGWFKSALPGELHLELAKLRAIENGMPFLRVANRGRSALIDPGGRVIESLSAGSVEADTWDVPLVVVPVARAPFSPRIVALLVFAGTIIAAHGFPSVLRRARKSNSRIAPIRGHR